MSRPKYYAVHNGRNPGIYTSWDACKSQVNGFSGSVFKSFATESEAQDFCRTGYGASSDSGKSASTFEHGSGGKYQAHSGITRNADWGSGGQGYSSKGYGTKSYPEKRRLGGSESQGSSSVGYAMGYYPEKRTKVDDGKVTIDKYTFTADENNYPVVFTDGACSNNGKKTREVRAGYGLYWGEGHPLNVSKRLEGIQTNQRAEIAAVNESLKIAKDNGIRNLTIKTDSKFVIDCATKWAPRWVKNNWIKSDGKPVVHKSELKTMQDYMKHVDVNWEHVRGHKGIHGNEMADKLAVAGSRK